MKDKELQNYNVGDDIAYLVGSIEAGIFLGVLDDLVLVRERDGNYVWELKKHEVFDISLYYEK